MRSAGFILLLFAFFTANLLPAQNASSYYRKIASEQRKIRSKQINYYKTALLQPDEKRLDKGRDMIVTQIQTSLKNMSRTPAFQGDSALRNDYIRILNTYLEAYTEAYDSVKVMKANAGKSAAELVKYRETIYYMEGMIDDAEADWEANEDYFTNSYNINAMDDPALAELKTLRYLSDYVQELRGTYSGLPFQLQEILNEVKQKKYNNLEDRRQELGLAVDQALVNAGRVGVYIDQEEDEDDFLLNATLRYLDEIKIATDDDMAGILTELDEAIYDEDDKKTERAAYKLEQLLTDLIEMEIDLNDRTEKFVGHYVKD